MGERAPYSRVYWSIVDDSKFESIYDDDHHLAAWLRLLLIADQAHPASAHLPANVLRRSVRALAEVGLIDISGQRYRVHGLDAERSRRASQSVSRLVASQDPSGTPNGHHLVPKRSPVSTPDGDRLVPRARSRAAGDETRRDEPSQAEDEPRRETGLSSTDSQEPRARSSEATHSTWFEPPTAAGDPAKKATTGAAR